MSIILT